MTTSSTEEQQEMPHDQLLSLVKVHPFALEYTHSATGNIITSNNNITSNKTNNSNKNSNNSSTSYGAVKVSDVQVEFYAGRNATLAFVSDSKNNNNNNMTKNNSLAETDHINVSDEDTQTAGEAGGKYGEGTSVEGRCGVCGSTKCTCQDESHRRLVPASEHKQLLDILYISGHKHSVGRGQHPLQPPNSNARGRPNNISGGGGVVGVGGGNNNNSSSNIGQPLHYSSWGSGSFHRGGIPLPKFASILSA